MNAYKEMFEFMPVETQVKVCKVVLAKLIKQAKSPILSSEYTLELDWLKGAGKISNFKVSDSVDDMASLLPQLEELVSILRARKVKS